MIVDSERLRMCLKAIRTQGADEVTVIPSDDGWNMAAVSPDHVTVAGAVLSQAGFPDGYVKGDPFCVNLTVFSDIMSGVKGACDIDVSTGRLVVKAGGYTYRKPLYAPRDPPKVPRPMTDTEVMLSVDLMSEFLTKAQRTSGASAVRLTVSEAGFELKAQDEQGDGLSLLIPAERCAVLEGAASTMYPLSEWAELVKALPSDADIDIRYAEGYPVSVTCADGVCSVNWLCAPRIEEE